VPITLLGLRKHFPHRGLLEQQLDVLIQAPLVRFRNHKIIPASRPNLRTQVALTVQGISGH